MRLKGIMLVLNSLSFMLFVKIAIVLRQKLLEFSQKLKKTSKSERELLFQNMLATIVATIIVVAHIVHSYTA